jgi:hypothetical protein
MPSFFTFQQGSESRGALFGGNDSSPLLGRFRAVPNANAPRRHRNSLLGTFRGGYGTVIGNSSGSSLAGEDERRECGDDGDGLGLMERAGRALRDLWLEPKQAAVGRAVDRWWSRWWVLVGLPAVLVGFEALAPILYGHLWKERKGIGNTEYYADEFRFIGRCMVCITLPTIRPSRRRRGGRTRLWTDVAGT